MDDDLKIDDVRKVNVYKEKNGINDVRCGVDSKINYSNNTDKTFNAVLALIVVIMTKVKKRKITYK